MGTYKAYIGLDNALVDLAALDPQPTSKGVRYTRTTTAASGELLQEGAYTILEWNILNDETAYQNLLDSLGVLDSTTSPVTVYCKSEIFTFVRYNGLAVRPSVPNDVDWQYFPRSISILIKNLEQLVEP